jgi:hypothetical protein
VTRKRKAFAPPWLAFLLAAAFVALLFYLAFTRN